MLTLLTMLLAAQERDYGVYFYDPPAAFSSRPGTFICGTDTLRINGGGVITFNGARLKAADQTALTALMARRLRPFLGG